MPQHPRQPAISDAIAILARARHHAGLPSLSDQDTAALADEIKAAVEIARAGRGTFVPAKWERQRIAWQLVGLLRQGRIDVFNSPDGTLTDFDLALLDLGLLSAPDERGWVKDPERGAREIEAAIHRNRQSGYSGQSRGEDGKQKTNRSGRRRDVERLSWIVRAIEIFTKQTGTKVTSSPNSSGAAFVGTFLLMSGYPKSSLSQNIAWVIARMTSSDDELEQRPDAT